LFENVSKDQESDGEQSSNENKDSDNEDEAVMKRKKRKRKHIDDELASNQSAIFFDQLNDPDIINNIIELESLIPMNFSFINTKS